MHVDLVKLLLVLHQLGQFSLSVIIADLFLLFYFLLLLFLAFLHLFEGFLLEFSVVLEVMVADVELGSDS